tara:strand:+ start:1581 stop:1730 length:150 start_codon:yes stop_codon:yes gene_type:complete
MKKPETHLSPAQRAAKLLAFKGGTHNFTQGRKPTPSKQINFSTGRNASI